MKGDIDVSNYISISCDAMFGTKIQWLRGSYTRIGVPMGLYI
jgi:hypothetical protein